MQLVRTSAPTWLARGMATAAVKLPDLPYEYSALEPYISGAIMEIHHSKHHATYVTNLNKALEQQEEATAKGDISKLITLQGAIKFNGGGHVNHDMFWKNLTPHKDYTPPSGELKAAIESQWKTLDNFTSKFNASTAAVQGSGWGWLGYNKATGCLEIATTANQDPLAISGLVPLLGVDVWEHAYYLQYKNVRMSYLDAIWKVVNWKDAEARLAAAKK